MLRVILVVACLLCACGRKPEPPPVPAEPLAAVLPAPPAPAAALPAAVSPIALPAPASTAAAGPAPDATGECEVEMGGTLVGMPVPAGHEAIVYVAIGDCSGTHAHILQRAIGTPEGKFFAEVFVPCGTDLMLCGSFEPDSLDPAPQPTTRYGRLDRKLHAVGTGEIEFLDLAIPMATGPSHTFPAPRP